MGVDERTRFGAICKIDRQVVYLILRVSIRDVNRLLLIGSVVTRSYRVTDRAL
jgi:hypothetical protein